MDLSLVVPVYNEEGNLTPLAGEIRRALEPAGRSYEVLFVDDGSTDGGPDELRRLAAADPALRVLRHERNAGQSAAFVTGFRHARGRWIVTLDADLQNDPADIPKLLELTPRFDVVSGVRVGRQDSWLRLVSSRIANAVRRRVTGDRIRDVGCSLKVYRAEFLAGLPAFNGFHRFLPGLCARSGARVTECPVSHRARKHGQAKYGVHNRLWRGLRDLLGVRWLQSRWLDPGSVEEWKL